MKPVFPPVRTTLVMGIGYAAAWLPLGWMLSAMTGPHLAYRLVLWGYFLAYGVLLAGWAGKRVTAIVFPSLFLLCLAYVLPRVGYYHIAALILFSWVRSGICFTRRSAGRIPIDLFLTIGAGCLIAFFRPGSPSAWALSIFLFMQVQSLYFMLFRGIPGQRADDTGTDAFDDARRAAEKILAGTGVK